MKYKYECLARKRREPPKRFETDAPVGQPLIRRFRHNMPGRVGITVAIFAAFLVASLWWLLRSPVIVGPVYPVESKP